MKLVCLMLGVVAWAATIQAESLKNTQKPNIVVVVIDDMGWNDIGYHNSAMETPNLDRFAKQGLMLERFYVSPVCSPTRAGLLTGRYPIRFGMHNGVCSPSSSHGMPPAEFTIPEMLAACGYEDRMLLGKWHLGHRSTIFHPLRQGFTEFYGHYNGALDYFTHKRAGELDWHHNYESCEDTGYTTDLLGNAAVKFIEKHEGSADPFLLYVGFNGVHSPVQAMEADLLHFGFDPDKPRIESDDAKLGLRENYPEYGSEGRPNTLRQGFKAMALAVDREFGRIMDTLDRQGLAENTLVFFTSDNGGVTGHGGSSEPLRGGKFTTFEGGVRVPAAIRWPGHIPAGTQLDEMVSFVDVLPTLAAAAGFDASVFPNQLDGVNMLPVLTGGSNAPDRCIYLGPHSGGGVATRKWKWVKGMLFDMESDRLEKNNVADLHPEIAERLASELKTFNRLRGPLTVSRVKYDAFPPSEWKIIDEDGKGFYGE